MTTIKAQLSTVVTAISGWNVFNSGHTTPANTLSSDLLDDVGASTGISLATILAFTGNLASSGTATGTTHGWEEGVWDDYWYVAIASDGAMLKLSGLNAGDTYSLKLAGARGSVGRDTTFSASGATNNPQVYVNAAAGSPTIQVELTGVVPVGGVIDITATGDDQFAYINGFELTVSSAVVTKQAKVNLALGLTLSL